MPSYDSDSSDEREDYSTTNVTLGYASADPTGDEISHLGGHSTWLNSSSSPPASLAKCKVCNSYMSLLLQLNADLQTYFPDDERRLHVFSCRKKQCSKKVGSIRAIREVRKPVMKEAHNDKKRPFLQSQPVKPLQDLGSALFGGPSPSANSGNGANPFSLSGPGGQPTANPFASIGSSSTLAALLPQRPVNEPAPTPEPPTQSFADKLKISAGDPSQSIKHEFVAQSDPWPSQSEFPPPYLSFHLDAYPEELEQEQSVEKNGGESSKTKYDTEDAGTSKEDFESSMDKAFQKFSDRVAQNPEQVLRYEYKGEPLLYSGTDDVSSRFVVPHGKAGALRGIPRCESCGAQRVFEVQLVPGLIFEVEKSEEMGLEDGMEWGTVIVGTCASNCGEGGGVSFREEWVGVQWEETVVRK